MNRRRGFFIFDLTLAIVLLLAIASIFARLMWLYNRDSVRLAAIRGRTRVEQAALYRVILHPHERSSGNWLVRPAKMASQAAAGLPAGGQWMVIGSKGIHDAPALYALRFTGAARHAGGKK